MAKDQYTANTTPNDTPNDLPSLGQIPAYKAVTDGISAVEKAYQAGLKITLAEVGFWRQIVQFRGKAKTSDPQYTGMADALKQSGDYKTAIQSVDRQDIQREYVFRCGDYFLPINLTYEVEGEKNDSTSQLVDGAEILQVLNYKPMVVTVRLRIERNLSRVDTDASASNLSMLDALSYEAYADQVLDNTDPAAMAIADLGVALRSLWQGQDVFKIENKVLNNDLGLEWVYMKRFKYTPNPGSTIVDVSMTLHQINMDENAIVFTQETVNTTNPAGGAVGDER